MYLYKKITIVHTRQQVINCAPLTACNVAKTKGTIVMLIRIILTVISIIIMVCNITTNCSMEKKKNLGHDVIFTFGNGMYLNKNLAPHEIF